MTADSLRTIHHLILDWYDESARDLPWRAPEVTAWAVMVSEFMLQQTPVARVVPVYNSWLERWPNPQALAQSSTGEAVRAWGKLGYPRRALRLHAAATAIHHEHDGKVPGDYALLVKLPGVGDYTASAIASFAFNRRHVVLDTNVRRVFARAFAGVEYPAASISRAERSRAEGLLPESAAVAANWAAATMELGAVVCKANSPECSKCPIAAHCSWLRLGKPAYTGPPRKPQSFAGTDRQCRGRLLEVLRASPGPVPKQRLEAAWSVPDQRERCLSSLVADGLAVLTDHELVGLPD